jgi:hypothetical protein
MTNKRYYKTSVVEGDNKGTINNIFEKVDISHLETWIEELHREIDEKTTLEIIVIASNRTDYEQQKNENIPLEKYGEKSEDWKPFYNEDTIFKLLEEFHNRSDFKINVLFLNKEYPTEKSSQNEIIKKVAPKTILILDSYSMVFEENRKFALLFDKGEIGGFLVPVCYHDTEDKKKQARNSFSYFQSLEDCWKNRFKENYMYIDLEVTHKYLLFRRLSDIAFKHLGKDEPKSKRIINSLAQKYQIAKTANR